MSSSSTACVPDPITIGATATTIRSTSPAASSAVITLAPPSTRTDSVPEARSVARAARRSTLPASSGTTSTRTPCWRSAVRRAASERAVVMTVVAASGPRILAFLGTRRLVSSTTRRGDGPGDHTNGELGIVSNHSPDADEDAVTRRSERMRHASLGLAADPAGVAGCGGDTSVEALGVLEDDERPIVKRSDVPEQRRGVDRKVGRRSGERSALWAYVPEAERLRVEVRDVAVVGGGGEGNDFVHDGAGGTKSVHLARVVGQQPDRAHSERGEDVCRIAVVA